MGGAAGLVLGLNLFVVFQFLGRIGKTCRDRVAYIMGTRKPKEIVVYVMFGVILIIVSILFSNGYLKSGYLKAKTHFW